MKWASHLNQESTIVLKRLESSFFQVPSYVNDEWLAENRSQIRSGLVLDVETTGLRSQQDKVIELAIRKFQFHRQTGEILKWEESYSEFEDPQEPLSLEIQKLTGISDDMVKGKKINWNFVTEIFSQAHLIIAHNSAFDRPFIEKKIPICSEKIWGCSLKQIDWNEKGFSTKKLEILLLLHGYFIENAHRALSDVDALLFLLHLKDESTGHCYFKELMENARRPMVKVLANGSPFESKDFLRKRGYTWELQNKLWSKFVLKEILDEEIDWLKANIYKGDFLGSIQEFRLNDHFKATC